MRAVRPAQRPRRDRHPLTLVIVPRVGSLLDSAPSALRVITMPGRVFLLVLIAAACGDPRAPARPSAGGVAEQVQARLPGRTVRMDSAHAIAGLPFAYARFTYAPAQGDAAYGSGIVVWRPAASSSTWVHSQDGDFPPHTITWRDLNADSIPDLLFLSGEEDVFATRVFVWADTAGPADSGTLVPVFRSDDAYVTLVDLDADGAPELIDPARPMIELATDGACPGLLVPAEIQSSEDSVYDHAGAAYADANFTWGSDPARGTLYIDAPVRILQLEGTAARDVTARFPEHLRWRIAVLEALPPQEEACRPMLAQTLAYLRQRLREGGG